MATNQALLSSTRLHEEAKQLEDECLKHFYQFLFRNGQRWSKYMHDGHGESLTLTPSPGFGCTMGNARINRARLLQNGSQMISLQRCVHRERYLHFVDVLIS